MLNRDAMRILTGLALILISGCTGDLVEIGPAAKADLAGSGGGPPPDMSQGQGPGGEMGPNAAKFFPDIQADVDRLGCTAGGCHGGTQIPVMKMGAVAGSGDANYTNIMNDINTTAPAQSPILTKNLMGSGQTHGGGTKFSSTSDPTYQKWLGWIAAGAPKQ